MLRGLKKNYGFIKNCFSEPVNLLKAAAQKFLSRLQCQPLEKNVIKKRKKHLNLESNRRNQWE